ncbi:mechanosensitive ion channel [Lysobacter sp. SG-8]|uniref:Mechanosensitive ion channel n=1 Tax=Marilutibacter penaei TaxID=2759900 RepID=A0A7W3U1B0_9GAMM|nr:mechanosensitive ion channel domain-containing protein [Lysobacter penaei]MBB1087069.1 mechanosensitive ion channel [Lysobacter penaei]
MSAAGASETVERAGGAVREAADKGVEGLQSALDYTLLHFSGFDITVGGVLAGIVALLVAIVVSALLRRALTRYGERQPTASRASLYTLSRVVHYVLIAVGLLVALELVGIPMAKFTLFAGALGVGLGFGLQAIFNNFVSGLILLFDRSLKVGDFVELESGVHGEVHAIQIRATRIVTNDNIDILVPNSEFVSGRVVNWTYRDVSRRIRVPFGVAYGTDKELVKKAALEAAAEVPFTLEMDGPRKPQVWLMEFGDSSLNFALVPWLTAEATKRPSAVKAAYLWALESALARHGIEIPFPQRDLHLRSAFGVRDETALAAFRRNEAGCEAVDEDTPQLEHDERAALASNDATLDVQQGGGADAPEPVERETDTENDDARER